MRHMSWARFITGPVLLGISLTLGIATEVPAACNTPAEANARFRGTFGSLDSPFLIPGEPVTVPPKPPGKPLTVGFKGGCSESPSGQFQPDDVVTLVFTPPSGKRRVVVLMKKCPDSFKESPKYKSCMEQLTTTDELSCAEVAVKLSNADTELEFTPPDTGSAGPVKVAVTAAASDYPCGLAKAKCSAITGVRACVDEFFEDPTCKTRHPLFPSVTALPPLNDFADLCTHRSTNKAPHCRHGKDRGFKFATDEYGNILVPMWWANILSKVGEPGTPCPPSDVICEKRDVDASTAVEAKKGGGKPIRLPKSKDVLMSFNLNGQRFSPTDPKFEVAPTSSRPDELHLVGDADKKASVLRIARCAPGPDCTVDDGFFEFRGRQTPYEGPFVLKAEQGNHGVCDGGANDGKPCTPGPPGTGICGTNIACTAVRGGVN